MMPSLDRAAGLAYNDGEFEEVAMRKVVPAVVLLAVGLAGTAMGADSPKVETPTIEVVVDRRVELVSIGFRLAGNPEYNMANSRSPYATDVERQFGTFRDHAAVQMARSLRSRRGISYDAVMSLAVHLDDKLPPGPRTVLDPRPALLDERWTSADAKAFMTALGKFAKDSGFEVFFEQHKQQYAASAQKLGELVNADPIVPFLDEYFGKRPNAHYSVAVGMLCGGGNYGVSMRYADGREEIMPVIGIYKWDEKGLPAIGSEVKDTIIHEFCHSYTNAIVDAHWGELQKAGEALFKQQAAAMRRQAYGNGKTLMYESFVRACVARGMARLKGEKRGREQTFEDAGRGFVWVPDFATLLQEYEANRGKYRTFEDFVPRVATYFDTTAEHFADLLKKFPRVKAMEPANGRSGVDAGLTKELVIAFDRPMQTGGWWLATTGSDRMLQMGPPVFNADHTELRVPVTLGAGRSYVFGLNPGPFTGFVSEEGYPLMPMEVRFSTRR
jgi:hypothetical protein